MVHSPSPVQAEIRLPFYISREYVFLWAGQTISGLGDYLFDTTLLLWIVTVIAPGQAWVPLAVSGLLLAESLPAFLVGPFAGVFVDRWETRRVLLAMDLVRAALIGLLTVFAGAVPLKLLPGGRPQALWQLGAIYLVVFLTSLCSQFFNPARLTLSAAIVPEIYRARATGFAQFSMNLAMILGPSLAAPLFFLLGSPWLLLFNASSFLFSFLMIFQVHLPQRKASDVRPRPEARHFWREFGDGVRFLSHQRVLATLVAVMCLVLFSAGLSAPLALFFATQNLHIPTSLYGLLSAANGVGLLVGALLLGWWGQRFGLARLFALGTLLVGILEFVYARQDVFWLACTILVVQGVPNAAMNIAFGPLVLKFTPREYLGRVWALILPAMNLAQLVATALGGYLVGTLFLHFHASLFGLSLGPYDTLISFSGLLSMSAGILALVNLYSLDDSQA